MRVTAFGQLDRRRGGASWGREDGTGVSWEQSRDDERTILRLYADACLSWAF